MARIRTIVNSPGARTRARSELRRVSKDIFHMEHIARGVLWAHWGRLTPADRRQFVALFTDLLERLVVAHLRQLRWATIVPTREVVGEHSASVTWRVATPEAVAVLEYRLQWRAGHWKLCDLLLNGHSFIAACREDFDEKIRSSSFRALLAELPRRNHAGFVATDLALTAAVAQ
jgi:phospholipid transport system substrate-binding protein